MPAHPRFDAALQAQFLEQLAALWPALRGSLTEVRKPCIRPHCPACARGDKHAAFLWTFTEQGRRRCRYVPVALAPWSEVRWKLLHQGPQVFVRGGFAFHSIHASQAASASEGWQEGLARIAAHGLDSWRFSIRQEENCLLLSHNLP